jgi:hypothetical protein
MARIISLNGDDHREVQHLLPWYVTGTLDGADTARVEAHLGVCPTCQAELGQEQRLSAEVAGLPLGAEQGWARMLRRLDAAVVERRPAAGARRPLFRGWTRGTPWLQWALAAQVVLILGVGGLILREAQPARYHVLGAQPASAAGNIVVIFRPDASEKDMRELMKENAARLVDGPTASSAYVLRVSSDRRAAALKTLRDSAHVVLAEPVDGGVSP